MFAPFPSTRGSLFSKSVFGCRFAVPCLALAAFAAAGSTAHAINLTVDFSLDSSGFFASNTAARNAVLAAASDLSAAITPSLGAIADDFYSGSGGGANATIDWALTYRNPVTNATVTLTDFSFAADSVTIYAGMRPLTGSTLGLGGAGGASIQVGLNGSPGGYQAAMNAAVANSDAAMRREGGGLPGPLMGTISGSLGGANYAVSYSTGLGQVSFDNDADNNGSVDPSLDNYWHYDHTTNVAAGKNDFYSVALHELLHSLGFGSASTWQSQVSGTSWTGSNAIALNGGSGLNLISSGGDHLADGLMSVRLSDGLSQEVAMDPSITTGTRKSLTQMDLAILRDLGYTTVPEPGSALLFAFGGLLLGGCRRRTRTGA